MISKMAQPAPSAAPDSPADNPPAPMRALLPERAPPRREISAKSPADRLVPREDAPQLQPAPRRSGAWLVWLLVIGIAGAAGYYRALWLPWVIGWVSIAKPAAEVKSKSLVVPILASAARQSDLDLYLNGLGTVTAFNTVTVRSRVEGELVRVAFNEGQLVKQGELLAEIDPRPFEVQLHQAEGQLAKDEAALSVAQLSLERYNSLASSRAITPQQIDEQVALVKQSEGAIKTDRSAIDNAQLQLTYCRITSPITGRIGLRLVDPGNIVRANDPTGLAVVTQLQPIAVIFTIPQDEIGRVQRKLLEGRGLVVEAFNRDFSDKLATGELLAIDNQVDSTTGTVRLKAVFKNEDNMLFPNQFVNARLLVDMKRDAVIVPMAAVQRGPDSMFVYVVKPDDTVEMRKVTTGPTEGDQISLESGLAPGEIVATDGIDKLRPGAKIVLRDRGGASQSDGKKLAESGVQDAR